MPGYPGQIGERGPAGLVGPTVRPKGQMTAPFVTFMCCHFAVKDGHCGLFQQTEVTETMNSSLCSDFSGPIRQ